MKAIIVNFGGKEHNYFVESTPRIGERIDVDFIDDPVKVYDIIHNYHKDKFPFIVVFVDVKHREVG